MLLKTHILFAVLAILLIVQHVESRFFFILMVLMASVIPDMDTGFSRVGKNIAAKTGQLFVKHRGIVHSLTIGIIVSVLFSIYWPVGALGFFVGWSVHMICDSFTKEGIQAFWPLKFKTSGFISTGGRFEESLFISMIFIDFVVFMVLFIW